VLALASTKKEWYSIKNAATPDARSQVHIYDEIGFMGKTAHDFIQDLDGIEGPIDLHLNSPGGEVFDGVAIYNTLLARQDVDVYVDGIAASIASVIAMAGDRVFIAPTAQLMVHNAFAMACGDATDLREMANQLERNTANIASIYAARTGQTTDHWLEMMDKESWFTGQEAVDAGLADSVIPMKAVAAKFDMALPPKVGKMAAKATSPDNAAHHPYHGHLDIHHEPMTGTHSHNHAEFGFGDGDDGIHAHSHTHSSDAHHEHPHMQHSHSHGRDENHDHAHAAGHEHYDNAEHSHTHHASDPDHDGDDDSSESGDRDHDYVLANGQPGPKAQSTVEPFGLPSPKPEGGSSSGSAAPSPSTTELFNDADVSAFISAIRG
jgi:ATP-dependent Clp endopeptidase proteolytic subunit ClpP